MCVSLAAVSPKAGAREECLRTSSSPLLAPCPYTQIRIATAPHTHPNICVACQKAFPLLFCVTKKAAPTLTGALAAAGSAAYFCCLSVMYSRRQAVTSATSPLHRPAACLSLLFFRMLFSVESYSQGRPATTCVCGGYACNACTTQVHTQCVWCAAILASLFRTEHLLEGCHLSGRGAFSTCSLHNRCARVCVCVCQYERPLLYVCTWFNCSSRQRSPARN